MACGFTMKQEVPVTHFEWRKSHVVKKETLVPCPSKLVLR